MKTAYNLSIVTSHAVVALCPKCDKNHKVEMEDSNFISHEKCNYCGEQFIISRVGGDKC
jgi:Zn ribbon nucleic-acid-binding protein